MVKKTLDFPREGVSMIHIITITCLSWSEFPFASRQNVLLLFYVLFDWHAPLQDAVETSNIAWLLKRIQIRLQGNFGRWGALLKKEGNHWRAAGYEPWSPEFHLASPAPISQQRNRHFNTSPHITGILHVHLHVVTTLQCLSE
jgi:hypothetical protein